MSNRVALCVVALPLSSTTSPMTRREWKEYSALLHRKRKKCNACRGMRMWKGDREEMKGLRLCVREMIKTYRSRAAPVNTSDHTGFLSSWDSKVCFLKCPLAFPKMSLLWSSPVSHCTIKLQDRLPLHTLKEINKSTCCRNHIKVQGVSLHRMRDCTANMIIDNVYKRKVTWIIYSYKCFCPSGFDMKFGVWDWLRGRSQWSSSQHLHILDGRNRVLRMCDSIETRGHNARTIYHLSKGGYTRSYLHFLIIIITLYDVSVAF